MQACVMYKVLYFFCSSSIHLHLSVKFLSNKEMEIVKLVVYLTALLKTINVTPNMVVEIYVYILLC